MPTATNPNTTSAPKPPAPSRRALFSAGAAILAGGAFAATVNAAPEVIATMATTPIADLNRRLHALSARRLEMDRALIAMPKGPGYDALDAAFEQNLLDCHDMQDRILALPAETLEDAAVLAAIAFYRADGMNTYGGMDEDEAEALSKELRAATASIIQAIVRTAGLDIDSLGQGEMRRLCEWHAPRPEGVA